MWKIEKTYHTCKYETSLLILVKYSASFLSHIIFNNFSCFELSGHLLFSTQKLAITQLMIWFFSSSDNAYGQAASTLVAGTNLEQTIQQLMDMGGGTWDKETVTRALRAAYNNPERAVDYLYSVCNMMVWCSVSV